VNISWEARACGGKVAQSASLSQVTAILGQNPTTGAFALGTESFISKVCYTCSNGLLGCEVSCYGYRGSYGKARVEISSLVMGILKSLSHEYHDFISEYDCERRWEACQR
jgi:hypothetical protein